MSASTRAAVDVTADTATADTATATADAATAVTAPAVGLQWAMLLFARLCAVAAVAAYRSLPTTALAEG